MLDPTQDSLTETGAAQRFCRVYGNDVRYDHARRRWLIWHQHHWRPDVDEAVTRYAIELARDWRHLARDVPTALHPNQIAKFAFECERRSRIVNILAIAKALKPVSDAGHHWDRDPWLLGVPNGVVDLRTGMLRPGQREDRITRQTTVAFNPDASCPRWERFLAEALGRHDGLVAFVHRAVGYSLTGDTSEQVLFLCYGAGANGKSTFSNRVKAILGDYSFNMPLTIELRERTAISNDLAALDGRRLVTASETNDGARLNEARVKMLTGGDPITARFLHAEVPSPSCRSASTG